MEALFSEITIGANPLTLWLALTLVITTYFFIANAAESTSKGKPAPSKSRRRGSVSAPSAPATPTKASQPVNTNATGEGEALWGRYYGSDRFWNFMCFMVLFFTPQMVFYFYVSCDSYNCELSTPLKLILGSDDMKGAFLEVFWNKLPTPTWAALQIFVIWEVYQMLLYKYLPGPIGYGQETPAGHVLEYNVNGFNAFILSNVLFFLLADPRVGINLFSPTIVYDNWGALLVIAQAFGYILAVFAYIKANYFPTHPDDVKFSGSFIFDFFMGAEFNPRVAGIDFKLFFNGRPGICAWNIINISFIYSQIEKHGHATNSIYLVTFLHFLYVIDFFWNEDWYLRTIDINHDHFGFYLAWGDSVWLPWMYTLQGFYLVTHPVELTNLEFAAVLDPWKLPDWPAMISLSSGCGILGYMIFRGTNGQKDTFRASGGKALIWGKPATYIEASYKTADGKTHKSLLLTSGFWGLARHFNYLGDLLISFAYCAACGFEHLLPFFYIIFMTILLLHRVERDHHRCRAKYGKYWDQYCEAVPSRIIPHIY